MMVYGGDDAEKSRQEGANCGIHIKSIGKEASKE